MASLLLDANVIVRFLTGDHPAHSPRSRNLFARAAGGDVTLVVTGLAFAETVWVLQSFYKLDRGVIAVALKDLIESAGIEVQNKTRLLSALRNFGQTNVNFVDAYHAAIAVPNPLRLPRSIGISTSSQASNALNQKPKPLLRLAGLTSNPPIDGIDFLAPARCGLPA